jgi:hypothetical protein
MGEMRNACNILVGKPERKIPLGRTKHRWKESNRRDLMKQGWKVWTGFIWLRIETRGGPF